MKKILVILMLVLTTHFSYSQNTSTNNSDSLENFGFKLHYMQVGFGSTMYELQPVFVINNNGFVYTIEEVWIYPNQTNITRDTLAIGNFRKSSIDSIVNIVNSTNGSFISKSRLLSSGTATYMSIKAGNKKLKIDLLNSSDATAERILNIINTYMVQKFSALED